MNNLTEKVEDYKKLIEDIGNIIPDYLSGLLTEIDTDNLIESVSFQAYRPYFNDGDRCDYSIYSYYDCMEYKLYDKDSMDYYDYKDSLIIDYIEKIGKLLDDKISIIPIEIFEKVLGDSIFTLFKGSVEIEDYTDHD